MTVLYYKLLGAVFGSRCTYSTYNKASTADARIYVHQLHLFKAIVAVTLRISTFESCAVKDLGM